MAGSLKVATIRGIPIRLHFTLLAMVVLLVVQFGWLGIPAGILLFGSVLLHELGHAVVAQRYGIEIAGIDLHLLGGMAMMKGPPDDPKQEIAIAAAGPAVSFVLGFVFLAIAVLVAGDLSLAAPRPIDLFAYGAALNLMMGAFNLLPALPMDGGRIFRATLSLKLPALKATMIAVWVSRAFATVFIIAGLVNHAWSLALIGIVLFVLVANEQRIAEAREAQRLHGAHFIPTHRPFGPDGPADSVTREEFVDPYGRRYVVVTRLK